MNFEFVNTPQAQTIAWVIVSIWSIFWKGIALWQSANYKQRNWFIAILLLNLLGLVEIIYLFKFSKKPYTPKTFIEAAKNFSVKN